MKKPIFRYVHNNWFDMKIEADNQEVADHIYDQFKKRGHKLADLSRYKVKKIKNGTPKIWKEINLM